MLGKRILLSLLGLALIPDTGWAQTAPAADPVYPVAATAVLLFGMFVAGYFAFQTFNRPAPVDQVPILPRYLTPLGQYRLGTGMFVALAILFYWLIVYFHVELFPIVKWVAPELYASIEGAAQKGPMSYPVIVVIAAAIYLTVLRLDHAWNPLLMLRDVIQRWVSIPHLADMLAGAARNQLVVPAEAKQRVVENPDTPYVRSEDFDKAKKTLDRRWAEASYLYTCLGDRAAQGSDGSFFNEPSFGWEAISGEYVALAQRVGDVRDQAARQIAQATVEKVHEDVTLLRRKLARLIACLLVVQNDSRAKIFKQAQTIGIGINLAPRENPLKYSIVFVVMAAFAVYFSVTFASTAFDVFRPSVPLSGSAESSDIFVRWVLYGVAVYCVPITGLLLFRYVGWCTDPARPQAYVITYAWMFVAAICLATVALATMIKLIGSPARAASLFGALLLSSSKWTITPALVSIYVVYHLDRRIDPTLPDINVERRTVPARVAECVLFALFAWMIILPPTMLLEATSGPWPTAKLRVVAMITSFFTALSLCLTAQFAIARSPLRRAGIDMPPLAPVGG